MRTSPSGCAPPPVLIYRPELACIAARIPCTTHPCVMWIGSRLHRSSYALYATDVDELDDEQAWLLYRGVAMLEEQLSTERRHQWRKKAAAAERLREASADAAAERLREASADEAAERLREASADAAADVAETESTDAGATDPDSGVARRHTRRRRTPASRPEPFTFPTGYNAKLRSFKLNLDPPAYAPHGR